MKAVWTCGERIVPNTTLYSSTAPALLLPTSRRLEMTDTVLFPGSHLGNTWCLKRPPIMVRGQHVLRHGGNGGHGTIVDSGFVSVFHVQVNLSEKRTGALDRTCDGERIVRARWLFNKCGEGNAHGGEDFPHGVGKRPGRPMVVGSDANEDQCLRCRYVLERDRCNARRVGGGR